MSAYQFLGLRVGQYTEVGDRLLVRGLSVAPTLEAALDSLER
jgi:hypothetical protein